MKIILMLIILLAILGLFVSHRNVSILSGDIKLADILTFVLIVVTAVYAWLTYEMAQSMKQANQINFRPYLQTEGLQQQQVIDMARQNPKNEENIKQAVLGGYLLALHDATGQESVWYNIRNLGQVPARDIKHSVEVYVVDEEENAKLVPPIELPTVTTSEVLFPAQMHTRFNVIGAHIIYTDNTKVKYARIRIKITYRGIRDLDPNTYFYAVTLRTQPGLSPEDLNRHGVGGMVIEHSDEGIERPHGNP